MEATNNRRKRINSLKRIVILLIILGAILFYKESIGEEFENFLTNYYVSEHNVQQPLLP